MKISKTDTQWEKWGKQNPYFGVLGVETREVSEGDTLERFFKTGRAHIDDVMETLEYIFDGPEQNSAALDFGCGVGRLLPPLAEELCPKVGDGLK